MEKEIKLSEKVKALNSYLETLDEKQLERFTNIINLGEKKC